MKVIFDENCATYNALYNEWFVSAVHKNIMDTFNYRGYIYASEISDHFGIAWDPHQENPVFISGETELNLQIEKSDDEGQTYYTISF